MSLHVDLLLHRFLLHEAYVLDLFMHINCVIISHLCCIIAFLHLLHACMKCSAGRSLWFLIIDSRNLGLIGLQLVCLNL